MTRAERRKERAKLHRQVKRVTGETQAPADVRMKTGWAHMRTNVFSREGAGRSKRVQRTMTPEGVTLHQEKIGARTVRRSRYSGVNKPGHIWR